MLALAQALAAFVPDFALACDVCAIYTLTESREAQRGPWLGAAEQFSHFATVQRDGREIEDTGERLDSSITQILFGYDLSRRFGVQLSLPVIQRTFRRFEDGRLASGDETGLGDLSLLAVVRPLRYAGAKSVIRLAVHGGLKLPSGDTDRLAEGHGQAHEDEHETENGSHRPGAQEAVLTRRLTDSDHGQPMPPATHAPHPEKSGVHGHDLALGSGSVDGIVGARLFASWRRLFLTTALQYAIRTEGAHDYRYANELTWNGGVGVFAILTPSYALALQAVVAGEHKGQDTLDGADEADSGITSVYLGPALGFSWGRSLGAEIVADLPLVQDNTGLQIVPDYRLRGALTWHF